MKKHTITLLNLVGLPLLIIAFVGFGPDFATQVQICQHGVTSCLSTARPPGVIGSVLFLMGAIPVMVGWVLGLRQTAQNRRWGWFVGALLTFPLGALAYAIAGPLARADR